MRVRCSAWWASPAVQVDPGKDPGAATVAAQSGNASIGGEDIFSQEGRDLKRLRRRMQIIFQDPVGSLNPRMPVSDIIGEGLLAQGDKENRWGDVKGP